MIHARVQAHPSRSHLHDALVSALELPSEVFLHASDPPSPWAGYVECLRDLPDCTHVLIIQDDAQVCRGFASALRVIAEKHPDTPVVLFLGNFPQGTAAKAKRAWLANQRYVSLHLSPIVPVVAVLWPKHKAEEFLAWAESGVKLKGHPTPRADDGVLAQWAKTMRQEFAVTVPSLVQHPGIEPSVKGAPDLVGQAVMFCENAIEYNWALP